MFDWKQAAILTNLIMTPVLMKRCKGPCGQNLPLDDFHWKSKVRGTRQSRCKRCMHDYGKEHYLENREEILERATARIQVIRADNADLLESHLLANPCMGCGEPDIRCLRVSLNHEDLNNRTTEVLAGLLQGAVVHCLNCLAKQGD
jgi:hypothetical protein